MTLDELLCRYKNGNRFEIETGLSHVNWLNWFKWGYIPIGSQIKIEKITQGELVADLDHIPWQNKDEK